MIRTESLCKTYNKRDSPVRAVDGLTFSVPTGQVFGFLGPNGAGKTTTIKMICGLVEPTSGSVYVGGHDVWRRRGAAAHYIGAVLEGTRNVHWALSARDNLLYFGHLKGMWGKELAARAEYLLHALDLWDWRDGLVRVFSRGMQQKVAVACALVADPPILLLDEPTLGLDAQSARLVKNLILQLAREEAKTVVISTHRLAMAQVLCDRVGIMDQGKLIANQPVGALLALFAEERYQITARGHLPPHARTQLGGLSVTSQDGSVVLSGTIAGPKALYHVIDKLRDMGLALVSIHCVEPNLEDVFLRLLESGARGDIDR
jgi:ABC-2 type transport system ATP-binding protein